MAPNSTAQNAKHVSNLMGRITRDQGPEFEQRVNFAGLASVPTPTSLKTDKRIKFIDLHFRGRVTIGGGAFRAGPLFLGTPLFSLLQQITLRGTHLTHGAQNPIVMDGEAMATYNSMYLPNYVPRWTNSLNGAAPVFQGVLGSVAGDTNDFDLVLPIPTFPLDLAPADIPFFCINGPDWPGNLYLDVACGDTTCLGITTANTTNYSAANGGITAYGSAAGLGTIDILTERCLLGKEYAALIRPAITFRQGFYDQPTAVVTGAGGVGITVKDLAVGKDTTRIMIQAGTLLGGLGAGCRVFNAMLDTILTRTYIQLDSRALRFLPALGDAVAQDYYGRQVGHGIPIGYRGIDFISCLGNGPANPKAAFQSSKLTAARKFEVSADVTAAGGQLCLVVQEMTLGRPALLDSAQAGSTA